MTDLIDSICDDLEAIHSELLAAAGYDDSENPHVTEATSKVAELLEALEDVDEQE